MATPKVWAKIQPIENPVSLLDITAEQLAISMQERELNKYSNKGNTNMLKADKQKEGKTNEGDTDSDEVIAHILQSQFNKEYDTMLKNTEKVVNRDAKVNISYDNYRTSSYENENEDNVDTDDSNKDFDRFVSVEREYASIPRCGYKKVGEGSQIVTKHDILMSSRINACRVLQFPPGIDTGDTGGFDMKLNNNVYNSLRVHSHEICSKQKAKASPKSKIRTK